MGRPRGKRGPPDLSVVTANSRREPPLSNALVEVELQ